MFDAKYHEQPEVHFKHELLLLMDLDGDSDSYIGWSSYQNFNKLLEEKARVPMIKVSTGFTSSTTFGCREKRPPHHHVRRVAKTIETMTGNWTPSPWRWRCPCNPMRMFLRFKPCSSSMSSFT